jgi:hypothetical protein
MESNLEALRMRLEGLLEVAQPNDYLRLKRTITLIRKAEVETARAKRQAADGVVWRYALDRAALMGVTANALDQLIQRRNRWDGALN